MAKVKERDEVEPVEVEPDGPVEVEGEAVEVDENDQPVPEAVTNELAVIEHERETLPAPASVLPSTGEWKATLEVAREIAGTPFVPDSYRGKPESVVAAILVGREMGIGPMAALRQVHMIDGRPAFSAELMLSQMRKGGLVLLATESTATRAMIRAKRRDTQEEATVEWTIEEARAVKTKERGSVITLDQKSSWRNYPADMLWARCVGRLARRLGSDLLNGMTYSSEEMLDWEETDLETSSAEAAAVAPATAHGVERRADAPANPKEIGEVLQSIDPDHPWVEWFNEAAVALFEKPRGELDATQTKELWVRWANGVATLRDSRSGGDFPPPTRAEVRVAFASLGAFEGLVLIGARVPMDNAEYLETVDGVYTPKEAREGEVAAEASAAQEEGVQPAVATDASLSPEEQERMAAAATDDIPFGEEEAK